jgi:hypothetical protein
MAVSLKEERFFGLPKAKFAKVLGDDYCHSGNTLETVKLKAVSASGAVVNYKTTFKVTKGEAKNDIKQSDELKFVIPYKKVWLYAFNLANSAWTATATSRNTST